MAITDEINGRFAELRARVDEIREAQIAAHEAEREVLRGIKPIRLPLVTGTASGSALTLGGDSGAGPDASPNQGFVWSVRLLVIEGMTRSSTTPDVVNILRNGRIVWQLNGNQFAQTWGRGEMLLNAGETFTYQSVGTFASTSLIIAHGLAEQVPAEMVGKFY